MTLETNAEARAAYVQDAGADLDTAATLNPEDPELMEAKARWHLMKGEKEQFQTLVAKVARDWPDSVAAENLLGLKFRQEGKPREALPFEAKATLRNLMNATPDQLLSLGRQCLQTKDAVLVRQGMEILKAGFSRAEGQPRLAKLVAEARAAMAEVFSSSTPDQSPALPR